MVIVHGVSTAINVDLLSRPEAFLWLKRRVVAGEPRPQLLGLVEGAVASSVHLHGLGRFCVGLYIPEPDLCGHCCRFGHQSWKCKLAPRCRYCSERVILPPAAWRRYVLAPESSCCASTGGTTTTPLRAAALFGPGPSGSHRSRAPLSAPPGWFFRPAPASQHNAWANGTLSWYDFPALPLPAAQPSAFPPLPGAAAPAQSGMAHPPVPATRPSVPVPPRTAPYYAVVVGAEGAAPASQAAGVPAILQDVVQLLLEIRAEVRDLRVRVTALERQRDAASPPPQPMPGPVQPVSQPARKNQPQSVPASPRPQPVFARVQPAPDNKLQSAPASPRPQPVSVPVHPLPQSAPDTQPQGVPASSRPR
ncbi:translation initiation factor IF-2-like [Portunus trituberculatus]|uniref:translation initiation factor IF-2-like n=1 Tax=Portunus trituberculatus TaxID=210409 RepID=UPI001E1CF6FC|nr:translation initiation factor IF-2-like [Portunus trituberculatus]